MASLFCQINIINWLFLLFFFSRCTREKFEKSKAEALSDSGAVICRLESGKKKEHNNSLKTTGSRAGNDDEVDDEEEEEERYEGEE